MVTNRQETADKDNRSELTCFLKTSAWGPRAWGSASLMNQTTSSTDQVDGSLLGGALDSWDSDDALYPPGRTHFLKHELKPTQRRSWICLFVTTYLSCCSLGTCSGSWTTAGTCSWRPNRWRTAATNETRRSSLASRTSLWSRKQNRQDPRSSVCRLTGLNGNPRP